MADLEVDIILRLKSSQRYFTRGELADACGVTAEDITKAIRDLTDRGYRIDHIAGEGYRLLGTPGAIDGADIRSALQTGFLGKEVFTFGRVTSTNDVAVALARGGADEGTLVVAEEQSRGRGRLGRTWFSPAGLGLWFSLVLRPSLMAEDSPIISLVVALGIAEGLEQRYGVKAGLKWPNDLLVGGRKICGILAEAEFVKRRVRFVVVGIGLNVLAGRNDFPAELASTATSLRLETDEEIARTDVLACVTGGIEDKYKTLCDRGFAAVKDELLGRSLLIGKVTRVMTAKGAVEGLAADIDHAGALVLRKDSGSCERIIAGDVVGIL